MYISSAYVLKEERKPAHIEQFGLDSHFDSSTYDKAWHYHSKLMPIAHQQNKSISSIVAIDRPYKRNLRLFPDRIYWTNELLHGISGHDSLVTTIFSKSTGIIHPWLLGLPAFDSGHSRARLDLNISDFRME